MGRYCNQIFRLQNKQVLYIVSAYRVCRPDHKSTSQSESVQQHVMLRAQGFENPKPWKQFILNLTKDIKIWQRNLKAEAIIMLDTNKKIEEEKRDQKSLSRNRANGFNVPSPRQGAKDSNTIYRQQMHQKNT
jgi:hypothetical protein